MVSPFVIFGLYEEARYKEISSYRADHYAKDADEAVKNACVALAGRNKAICLQEKGAEARLQKHDNERSEADLVAQRKSAMWTSIMGFAALIGMGLSAIAVYLVWRTWESTQEAAKNSRDTLDSYIHRERAILRFGNAHYQSLDDLPVPDGFQAQVLNFGASTADFISVAWEYLEGPCWPQDRPLRCEVWPDNISTPGGPAATPHLGIRDLSDRPLWLAVMLAYRTLGVREYQTFRSYKIGYTPKNELGEGGYHATPVRIAYQPANT